MRALPLAMAILTACSSGPPPGPARDWLVALELRGGRVESVRPLSATPSSTFTLGVPSREGNLALVATDASGVTRWSGFRYANRALVSETVLDDGTIQGTPLALDAWLEILRIPEVAPGEELTLRATMQWNGAPVVSEHTLRLGAPPGASTMPLDADDVCGAETGWDATIAMTVGTGDHLVVLVPYQFPDAGTFETEMTAMLAELQSVDWFDDAFEHFTFGIWRANCVPQDASMAPIRPDTGDLYGVLSWLDQVVAQSELARGLGAYRFVAVSGGGDCGGLAYQPGERLTVYRCNADAGHASRVVAHELGHSIGGLSDEYIYASTPTACGAADGAPNRSIEGHLKWACPAIADATSPIDVAETRPVLLGEACGDDASYDYEVSGYRGIYECYDHVAPCPHTIMRHAGTSSVFGPVGRAAMTQGFNSGGSQLLTYEDCGCSESCDGAPTCGRNECGGLCENCDPGDCMLVGGGPGGALGYACVDCPGDTCWDTVGRTVCVGENAFGYDSNCPAPYHLGMYECVSANMVTPATPYCVM